MTTNFRSCYLTTHEVAVGASPTNGNNKKKENFSFLFFFFFVPSSTRPGTFEGNTAAGC